MTSTNNPFGYFMPKVQKPAQARRVNNFLEAFKESAVKRPAESMATTYGELKPGTDLNVSAAFEYEERKKQEEQIRAQERAMARQREEEQKAKFENRQKEISKQIEQLREAILKIAKSTRNVSLEIEKAAFEAPAAPGIYHLNFFEGLKRALELIKKRLDDSATWMQAFNQRNKRMPFYWQQVKKSGTKYMLSQERSIATSAG